MATEYGLEAFDAASGAVRLAPRLDAAAIAAHRRADPTARRGHRSSDRLRRRHTASDDRSRRGKRELWTSRFLKPYFNDALCFDGHCYGFDGRIFTSIDLDEGARNWKAGRYGNGQAIALPAMAALLVLTEQGEIVLVEASPEAHRELARLPALDGKSWNHPVVADGKLLVRNGREAVCYALPASEAASASN